jgi:hypothetical protein
VKKGTDTEAELTAIRALLDALGPLDEAARTRVVEYVFDALNLSGPATTGAVPPESSAKITGKPFTVEVRRAPTDIRSLAEEKAPRSASEMAAVVGYYLAEAAPERERKDTITAADIRKYFKQALYRLPSDVRMTLVHAKNAGYLDVVGRGTYALNPVGYNLVAHGLPKGGKKIEKKARRRSTKRSKKA